MTLTTQKFLINARGNAFTVMELMVVAVILGVLVGIAAPAYTKAMEHAHLQDALTQLSALHSANKIYFAKTTQYWPESGTDIELTDINSNLLISVIANGMTYRCDSSGNGAGFTCTATRDRGAGFVVTVTQAPLGSENPKCTSNCP